MLYHRISYNILRFAHYFTSQTVKKSYTYLKLVATGVVGVLLDEGHQGVELSGLLVLDRVGLVGALEEVQSGESLDGQAGDIDLVGGRVHLGDHNVGVVLEVSTQLVPDRGCEQKRRK